MSGKGRGLVRYALHHVAVAYDCVYAVIKEREPVSVVAAFEVFLRYCHSDTICKTLAQRPCCCLNAPFRVIFRVSGRGAPPLPEIFKLLKGHIVSGKMQKRIEEHASVAGRKDKPVAAVP